MDCKDSGEDRGGKKRDSYDRSVGSDSDTGAPFSLGPFYMALFYIQPILTHSVPHSYLALLFHLGPFYMALVSIRPCFSTWAFFLHLGPLLFHLGPFYMGLFYIQPCFFIQLHLHTALLFHSALIVGR